MGREEVPFSSTFEGKRKEGGSKMALLAAPRKGAFLIDSRDADILNTRSGAVLEALQKIRKAEASGKDTTRLRQLDERISTLRAKGR